MRLNSRFQQTLYANTDSLLLHIFPQIQPGRCPQICWDREGGRNYLATPAAYLHNLFLLLSHPLMLLSFSAASYLADKFLWTVIVSALSAALPKIENSCALFAGGPSLQTTFHLLQWQPSALPQIICPNPSTYLQGCIWPAYETKLFKVEILLIHIPIIQCVTLSAVLLLY